MTAAEATLYGAIIAGTFTLLGVLIERLIRGLGRLRCAVSASSLELSDIERGKGSQEGRIPLEESDETTKAKGVFYNFAIDLFNGAEVPIGLRDISVDIVLANGRRISSAPYESVSARNDTWSPLRYNMIDVINLPPRQFVHQPVRGTFDEDAASVLTSGKWNRVEVVAKLPKRPFFGILGSKTFCKTVASRPPYRDPFVQRSSS